MTGKTISHYQILEKLGGGGMGVVYKAEDTNLHRVVALKFLPESLAEHPLALERFRREARAASALNHPNICTVYDIDEFEDRPFIAMEYVDGPTLRQYMAGKPLELGEAIELALQVADGLGAARVKNIVHRDIKSANIMLNGRHQVKITDFGLAKSIGCGDDGDAANTITEVTAPGVVMGTVAYMSPEQAMGREVDHCSDLFSFGVVLYEMLAGKLPFKARTTQDLQVAIAEEVPPPFEGDRDTEHLPESLRRVLTKMIAKDSAERYQTAGEIHKDLIRVREELHAGKGTSIAVLPFVNMSPDSDNEYFSDGLTEELMNELSNVKGLRVVARTSVFRFKGKSEDVRKIGAELNAHMVLGGSVRKSGDRLRITAQLSDTANGYQTWSRTYRVEMKDLFAVQEEIARAIAATLSEGARDLSRRHTGNLEAYHDYLKGRFHLNKWTEDDFRKSIAFFEAAIRKDPEMAAAWAGLADARYFLACYGRMAPQELMPEARMAAEKAVALDDSLAEAHVSLGAVRALYDWDWAGSEEQFRRAIDLDADCAQAYQWLGVLCLLPQGRMKEAETAIRRALNLDPLSPGINTSLGLACFVQGKHDEAGVYFEKALETDPNFYMAHWWLGARVGGRPVIYLQRSMLLKAFAQFRRAGARSQRDWPDPATCADELGGKGGKAHRTLEKLTRISGKQYYSPVMIAAIHVTLGETDAAFEWLGKAYVARDPWLAWLGVDRRFDRVRQDGRFAALLKKIGVHVPSGSQEFKRATQ